MQTTLRQARARYFEDNGFGADGGYNDAWVDFKLGPIPFPFPNTAARVRAVKYHDLHHVLTGYRTDLPGELEISAWEIGAGCGSFIAAWQLNLGGMGMGALFMPRRTLRAFVRGLRSRSLYGLPLDALLDESVEGARVKMGVAPDAAASSRDVLLFAATAIAGVALGIATLIVALPLAPLGVAAGWVKRARAVDKKRQRPGGRGDHPRPLTE